MKVPLQEVRTRPELARLAQYKVANLAKLCGVTVRCLERYFVMEQRRTPHAWLNEVRQSHGLSLLLAGKSVKATAFELGYQNACNFSRDFRSYFGVPPGEVLARAKAILSRFDSSLTVTAAPARALVMGAISTAHRMEMP